MSYFSTAVPRHRPVGSQWGKWDLHFHIPFSFDYHDKSVSGQQIIEGLRKNGIDVVAISRFDLELKSVIFSHVSEDKMLGAGSLDELLKFKTAPLLDRLKQHRLFTQIADANRRVYLE